VACACGCGRHMVAGCRIRSQRRQQQRQLTPAFGNWVHSPGREPSRQYQPDACKFWSR
jgi:hypothetical protein